MKRFFIASLLVLVGCFGAHRDNPATGDDTGPVCGDVTCDDKPANTCVDGDTLRSYEAACSDGTCSYPSTDFECGSDGCCGDHCCAIAPSNTADVGLLEPTGLVVVPPSGGFDTDTECVATSPLGKCAPVARDGLPEACVCRVDELTINTLKITGSRALVILAFKQVVIKTMLDVSGDAGRAGPGSTAKYDDAGGVAGGHGGSFATIGGSSQGGLPAATYGEPTLEPLLGGMAGRAAGDAAGGGGGALQITAGVRIEVQGTINAGGGGGKAGIAIFGSSGGGGGGSGGAVLVEAPTVVMSGVIVANGGAGGGGGGTGGSGSEGYGAGEAGIPRDPLIAAWGGGGHDGAGCPLYGYVSGGDGGFGAAGTDLPGIGGIHAYDSRCIGSVAFVGGGGAGGGVGRVRVNTTTGCQCGGKISPQATFGAVVKQ